MAAAQVHTDLDRRKMIIAIALGALALLSLAYAFGGSFFSSSTRVSVTQATPTPSRSPSATGDREVRMPSQNEQDLAYQSTPITYSPVRFNAPDPGRNIFAFYEPPPPCPECPTPTPKPPPPPPPEPTPPVFVAYVTPQNVYAGSKNFRLEVHGDKFTPETKIYLNQAQLPTSFINEQRLSTEIPSNLIASASQNSILVRTPDGRLYSNPFIFNVQPPPAPNFVYIGMIARQHANNDTAYFTEQGKQTPTTARLNDVVAGRFRLISISAERAIFEDTGLGFKHTLAMQQATRGAPQFGDGQPVRGGGFPPGSGYIPNPSIMNPNVNANPPTRIPGIPDNIPRVNTPANARPQRDDSKKDDSKDDDDGDTDNR